MAISDKEVVFTQPDRLTVAVPKSDAVSLAENDFDKTIVKDRTKLITVLRNSRQMGEVLKQLTTSVGIKLGDSVKTDANSALTIGEVFAEKPITEPRYEEEPLAR